MEIFKIENVSFIYPEQHEPVLKSIDLSIHEGEFIVIFGESGSGKTTLLNMLKRELTPHGEKIGSIYYKEKNIEELDDRTAASEIGYVMQNPENQIITDKVWHELAFGLENLGIPTEVIRRQVGEIANYFGIHTWFQKKTTDLSGGQKQLLNLASIMVMQPNVLLLDEPTSQLDPIAATNFIHTLEKLNRDLGLTIILVEHRLEEVLSLADRVVLLEKGKMLCVTHPRKVGECLKELDEQHPMLAALPTATKVFHSLNGKGDSPLTVREGKRFLSELISHKVALAVKKEVVLNQTNPVIELKNTWFRYERDLPDVLAGVDVKIYQGEIVTILGGNGSGKTTLLQVLSGQNRPYRGKVWISGKKIQQYKGKELYRHHLAVLPQDPRTVFIKDTVREDYKEISKVLQYSEERMEQLIEEIARDLAITKILHKHPYDISGGEQQKVALGKILLLQPKILLLDEPTKGIDAFSKKMLLQILKDLKDKGLTIIIVTHDIEFAAHVSDRVGLFFDRNLLSIDTPTAFFSANNYYTTVASRMSRHIFDNTITVDEIIQVCQSAREIVHEKAMD
ncbi:ABC transporter ATP-binding protein [Pseudogracilibacillus auburnensis]|uniref:Energy-coupling factor transport system ATP-binding protein n=1 Tax=Pseudogracilibacillus auburnensis TaxID=1494959 RepID=A0A2V3VGS3_9BACI|nr:ABC transporter ATP-binding protein [Pseudogracilibacillus auburnensis]PXW80993.1 energy-coupling factor transport system ATP-binding protein [Pseudogracilibacillus auburnensis]